MINWTDIKDFILSCCGNTSDEWTRGDTIGTSICLIVAIVGFLVIAPMRISEISQTVDIQDLPTVTTSLEFSK